MAANGHLNGSQDRGEKGYFCTLKCNFPIFLIWGSAEGREGREYCLLQASSYDAIAR